jgi:acetyltransferase-like isoleucine patch superfamily enzyme
MLGLLWRSLKRRLFVDSRVNVGQRFHIGILSYVGAPKALTIGDDVYIGKFCSIQCSGSIGNGVLIANNVGIVGRRDHDMREVGKIIRRASWIGDSEGLASDPKNHIAVGDDVWIGYGAILLSGIVVGRGAVIAAGSVVTSDVEPYAIVTGNPAQPVGVRFTQDQIISHERALART